MKFRDLDDLYSKEEVTIFDICDYFGERYGETVVIYWDCQEDISGWKGIFRKRKVGYEIKDSSIQGQYIITFFDKERGTVSSAEEQLKRQDKYDIYRLLKGFKTDGLMGIDIDGDNIVIDYLANGNGIKEGSIIGKLRDFYKGNVREWETTTGLEMESIVIPRETLIMVLEMMG